MISFPEPGNGRIVRDTESAIHRTLTVFQPESSNVGAAQFPLSPTSYWSAYQCVT